MKAGAVAKTFSRKARRVPPPDDVDFDTMRDSQGATDSSQEQQTDSQRSLGSSFDLLLAEPDAPAGPSSQLAAIPKPMRLQATQAAAAKAVGSVSPQKLRRRSAASLFDAMQQQNFLEKTAQQPCLTAPSSTKDPHAPSEPTSEPLPAPRKRKVQLSYGSEPMGPPAARQMAGLTAGPAMQSSSGVGNGAPPQRTAGGSVQRAADGSVPAASAEYGTAARSTSSGSQGPVAAATGLTRTNSGRQRGSGGSQTSQATASPSKRVAAITLVEAQDSGESVRIMDDLMYALDGLSARLPASTQQESAIAIAEAALTQRGRMALRSEGAIGDVLKAADGLPLARDPLVAAALAALLLSFSRAPLDQQVLVTPPAMSLLGKLLRVPDAALGKPATAVERMLRGAAEAAQLSPAVIATPQCAALATLAGLLHHGTAASDAGKRAVREHDLLRIVALTADATLRQLTQPPLSGKNSRHAWLMQQAMLVLEHATFASPKNEAAVVGILMPCVPAAEGDGSGSGGIFGADQQPGLAGETGEPFPQWLVRNLAGAVCGAVATQPAHEAAPGTQEWLHAGLSVLMNVTHNNEAGREAVAAGGGLETLAQLVACCAAAALHAGDQQERGLELLTSGLGVLINLASGSEALRAQLAVAPVAQPVAAGSSNNNLEQAAGAASSLPDGSGPGSSCADGVPGGSPRPPATLIPLLCRLVAHAMQRQHCESPRSQAAPSPAPVQLRSPAGVELTTEQLERVESAGAASILEAYSAMLLGFLVVEDAQLRSEAAAALPGGSLAPVATAVEQCLHFYLAVGAMPAENEHSLRQLVTSLRRQHPSDDVMVDGQT